MARFSLVQIVSLINLVAPAILSAIPETAKYAKLIMAALAIAEQTLKSGAEKRVIGLEVVKLGVETANKIQPGSLNSAKAEAIYENSVDLIIKAVNKSAEMTVCAGYQDSVQPETDRSVEGIFQGQ